MGGGKDRGDGSGSGHSLWLLRALKYIFQGLEILGLNTHI